LIDHRVGRTDVACDGSVVWFTTRRNWNHGFLEAWAQLDRGVLGEVP
jgi:hypothetical protein